MTDEPAHHSGRGATWVVRAVAVLLLVIGVYPLADRLNIADPQQWWLRAWHAWRLWIVALLLLAFVLARDNTAEWGARAQRWRVKLLAWPPRRFALAAALLTAALSAAMGWIMFASQPVTIDEQSQLWQAHLLTYGRLFAVAEPHPEFFSTMQTVTYEGRWFSHFPIGGPAVQALGLLLHAGWLVNPMLAAVAAMALYRFASRTGDEAIARLTTLLFALSPFVLIIAGSRLDHVATLAAVWVALAAVPAWLAALDDEAAARAAAVIGLGLGCAVIVRPYDGTVATLVVGLFQLTQLGRRGIRWRSLAAQALAGAIPIAVLLLVNRALTGHPLRFAYDVLNGPDHRPGFHLSPLGYEHTPLTGLFRVSTYVMRMNAALLGWPVPVVAVMAIAMLAWRRASRWDVLLCGFLVATLAAYVLYWGDGSFHGPRFLFEVAPVFLLWIARFPSALRQRIRAEVPRVAVLLLLPLWLGAAWLVPSTHLEPFGVWSLTVGSTEVDWVSRAIRTEAAQRHGRPALVFIQDGWHNRLTARLRALGVAPFAAQLLVGNFNACTIQKRLDDAERRRFPAGVAVQYVTSVMREPNDSRPVHGLSALEQLALPPSTSPPAGCEWEYEHALARRMDMARLLPYIALDASGRLGGDVVFARDFGARNELLRNRFGDREWLIARPVIRGDSVRIELQPWVASDASSR